MIQLVLYSLLIMMASLVGVISLWREVGLVIGRHLSLLVSLSAGVFTFIAIELSEETITYAPNIISGIFWIAVGGVSFFIIFKLLPSFHHHHSTDLESSTHSRLDARGIMASDALHNIGDGVLLAAAFSINQSLGMFTVLNVFIHEVVQEISEFFVLQQAGFSAKRALALNFLISGTILIGALGGSYLLENSDAIKAPLFGISAGAFLMVVVHDLIPHSVRESKQKNLYSTHIAFFLSGIALMFLVS